MATTFGPQPALGHFKASAVKLTGLSRLKGIKYTHLMHVLHGRTRPSQEVIEAVTEALDLPAEECFTGDALARPYMARTHLVEESR